MKIIVGYAPGFSNKSVLNDYLLKEVNDDAIVKINTDGEIFLKSN